MAEALSAFLQAIFQNIIAAAGTALIEELHLVLDVKEELKSFALDVSLLQAYLRDALLKQQAHEAVRQWLANLQEVAYAANDLLDECAFEAQRQKVIPLAQMRNSFSSLNLKRGIFLHKISRRVRELKAKIEESKKQRSDYGLQPDLETPPFASNESSSLEPPLVLGRDGDERKMIDLLMESGGAGEFSSASVVCIVGIGGIGKTTLAQRVYNNERVGQSFKLRSWVHVSQDFGEDKLTKAILESIDGFPQASVSLDNLQKELLGKLRGKKYLIVLDDVWTVNWSQWQKFRIPLLQGAMGSKILVTTRSVEVAKSLFASTIHHLLPLRDEDCWSLFFHYMAQQNPAIKVSDLQTFSADVAQRCNGLPSAAEDLAFRLSQEPDRRRWRSILQNETVDLTSIDVSDLTTSTSSNSSRAGLSYQLLPPQLKPCFALCSVFPNDFEFEKEDLVKLWMAQNFIMPSDDMRIEDVGSRYFEFLERRSLFQYSRFDPKTNRSKHTIHSSIHNFIRYSSKRECIIIVAEPGHGVINAKARHLSLMCRERAIDFTIDFFSDHLRGLYTLVIFGRTISELPEAFTKKLENLRALDLSNTGLQKLPDSIGHLKHLRCLQLRSTKIRRLPDTLGSLYLLQTLGLGNCYMLEELPDDLKKLQNLRHIDLHWDEDSMMMMSREEEDVSRLLKRRHGLRSMPPEIGLLINLQTLSRFVASRKNGCGLRELSGLNHIHGELLVSNLHLVQHAAEAAAANLKAKQHLQCLELRWADVGKASVSVDCILCELQPHSNLKGFRVVDYMGSFFPTWLGSCYLSNLTSLTLANCRKCFSLPPLGNLPLLAELHIEGMDAVRIVNCAFCGGHGEEMPFRALKRLHFVNMPNLKQWCGNERCALHSLLELTIRRCSVLERITHAMPSLEKLVIEEAPRLAGLPELQSLLSMEVARSGEHFWELFSSLTSLSSLNLRGLSANTLPTKYQWGLDSLQRLEISYCDQLVNFPDTWPPSSLKYFAVKHCPVIRHLPNELKKLRALEDMEIHNCPQLSSLPDQVGQLKSLVRLDISDCPWLLYLPCSFPNTLQILSISNCPRLKERCRQGGEDWPKIRDVFSVWIDGEMVISPVPKGENSGYSSNNEFSN